MPAVAIFIAGVATGAIGVLSILVLRRRPEPTLQVTPSASHMDDALDAARRMNRTVRANRRVLGTVRPKPALYIMPAGGDDFTEDTKP